MEELEDQGEGISPVEVSCENCQATVAADEVFCPACGFPQNGTEDQKQQFKNRIHVKKKLLREVEKEVKKGKNTLIVLGILNGLIGLYYAFFLEDIGAMVVQMIVAIIYIGLSIWVDKQPFGALLSALILYLTIVLILAVIDPVTIFSGIIWKILIIGFLVRGIKSGHEARNIYRELEDLGVQRT